MEYPIKLQWLNLRSRGFVALLIFFLGKLSLVSSNLAWPIKRMSYIPGDLIIGGFFPVHGRSNQLFCQRLQEEGFYQLESFIYTVKKINEDPKLLPNIQLGILAVDSCDSEIYALEEATQFVKGFIARDNAKGTEKNFMCNDSSQPKYLDRRFDKVVGIVGGHSSFVSIQLANMFRLFKMPQVSYQSTDPRLSDRSRYEYFFRTVPQLGHQVAAIVDILSEFKWSYISVVYSDTPNGNKGFEILEKLLLEKAICISSQHRVSVLRFKDGDYDNILFNLERKNATVVVVFGGKGMARELFSAATRHQVFRFIWIGNEAWGSRKYVTEGNEKVLEGALSVSHVIRPLEGFEEYIKDLSAESHQEMNPWFLEFWEERFKCKYENFDFTPFNKDYDKSCAKSFTAGEAYIQETPSVQFVRDAVYAIAQALHNLLSEKCPTNFTQCVMGGIDGKDLRNKIAEVEFKDEFHSIFRFDANGDAPPRYSIINFQRKSNSEEYDWSLIGSYSRSEDDAKEHLVLDQDKLKYKHDRIAYPTSTCSHPCKAGEIKMILDDDNCCWHCLSCTATQFIDSNKKCAECFQGMLPDANKTHCEKIPLTFMQYSHPLSIGTLSITSLGIILNVMIFIAFWIYGETPIVTASGRDLNYFSLAGIFLSFCMTFVIVSKPTSWTCGIVRVFVGICYTFFYAVIVVRIKTIVILSQLENQKDKKVRPVKLNSPLTLTLILVSIEGIINTTWLLNDPPATSHQYPTWKDDILICEGSDSISYLVGLIYPLILTCFSTFYALKIKNMPGKFDEVRLIILTNCTTFVIWLAFLPTFIFNNNYALRPAALSFFLNFSCLVQLACLFLPKVYIAVLKPDKNTDEYIIRSNKRQFSSLST